MAMTANVNFLPSEGTQRPRPVLKGGVVSQPRQNFESNPDVSATLGGCSADQVQIVLQGLRVPTHVVHTSTVSSY